MVIFSFIHLMATSFPVLMLEALITSENVPSPILDISLYSKKYQKWKKQDTIHLYCYFLILIF